MTEILNTKIQIDTYFEAETYSPYAMAKSVNAFLKALGSEKVLPPQMFYTYVKKAYIPADEAKKVTRESAIAWTTAYVLKHLS